MSGRDEQRQSSALDSETQPGPGIPARGASRVLDADEVQGVLSGSFYSPLPSDAAGARPHKTEPKPAHYKVICISLYTRDLQRLDGLVEELKSRGITKANRSALIRAALDQIDLDKVPRGM